MKDSNTVRNVSSLFRDSLSVSTLFAVKVVRIFGESAAFNEYVGEVEHISCTNLPNRTKEQLGLVPLACKAVHAKQTKPDIP